MITEKDLNEAIAECQGVINPTSNTCIKLASYFTIKEHMFGGDKMSDMRSIPSVADVITISGDSEFAERVNGRSISDVMPIIDELMATLQVVNPRLYNSVINRL